MNVVKRNELSWLLRLVRLCVVIFVPWFALWRARKALHLAGLIIKNEAFGPSGDDERMMRWADECLHDGWVIYKPYSEDDLPA